MASFAAWAAWPDREEIVLVELNPSLVLTGWTAVGGGAPNSYQVSCPALVGASQVPGGVYRRVTGVKENGTALTERANLAAVDANASSWFWDESAGVLYVRTSSGADPDTFTVYHAGVRFYLATTGVVLNRTDGNADTGIYHQPWLVGDVPALVQETEDLLFGVKTTPGGEVTASNAHGFWHTVIAHDGAYAWKHKRVTVLLGGRYQDQTLLRSQYVTVATMLVEDVAADEHTVTWALKPLARLTDQTLPVTPYFESSYPQLGNGVRGTLKWIGYGRAWVKPDLTDASGAGVWTIADAAYQALSRVHAVYAVARTGGVVANLSEGQDYTVNLTACTVTVTNAAYGWSTHDLRVDVTGKPGGARGWLSTFSEIVQDILTTHLGVAAADLDSAAFAAAQAAAPQELACWIKSPRTIASILSTQESGLPSLEQSVHGTVFQTRAGLWTCRIWEPTFDASGAIRLRKEDFARFQPAPKLETVYVSTRVHYGYHHGAQEWAVSETSDARAQYLAETTDRKDVYTYLRNSGDAQVLASRYQFVLSHAQLEAAFAERGTLLAEANPGDRVQVTFSPAAVAAGAFADRACEITRIERRFAPKFTISGVLEDLDALDNLPRTVGEWSDPSAPNWGSASAAQRESQGFWCDTNGRADSGDPASEGVSRWW